MRTQAKKEEEPARGSSSQLNQLAFDFQKLNLSANWKLRCRSVPPAAVELITPRLLLCFSWPDNGSNDPTNESGLLRFTWLKKFTDSIRNSSSLVSVKWNFLKSDASVRQYPGPRRSLIFSLPNVPLPGLDTADVLKL